MAVPFQAAAGLAGGSGTSRTVTIATGTGTGDTLLVVVAVNNVTLTVSACGDSKGNTYTFDRTFSSSVPALYAFRSPGASGGPAGAPTVALTTSDTVTVTTSATGANVSLYVVSVPGVGAVDQIATLATGTSTTGSVSATPAANNETAVSYWSTANAGGAPTVNSPFTSLGSFSSGANPYDTVAYDVLTGGSGVALTSTVTITSASWRGGMWTFQPGSGGGSVTAGVAAAAAVANPATVSIAGGGVTASAAVATAAAAANTPTVTLPAIGASVPVVTPLVLPQIIVEAAMSPGQPVSGPGTMTLDDASFGILDTDWLAVSDSYSDLSAQVLNFTITRSSSRTVGPVLQFQAGTATVTLDGSDGSFDPDNASGPYYGQIHAMVPVRIRANFGATGYHLYRGFADSWMETPVTYSAGYSEWVLSATDGFKILAGRVLPAGLAAGAGEDAGARVNRILDAAAWYSGQGGGARMTDTGDSSLQATTFGSDALSLCQLAADSEAGQLYIDGTGAVVFRRRRALLTDTRSATPQAVFGDAPAGAELPCAAVARADDDTMIANDIQATSAGGTLQELSDTASVATYLFPRSFARADLILQSDADTHDWAAWVLYIAKDTEDRFDSVTVDPAAQPGDLWPQVLGRDIGDRITVTRRPPQSGAPVGTPVTRDCFITGITHSFDAVTSAWSTVWTLADASKYVPTFTLNDAALGRLDHNSLAF